MGEILAAMVAFVAFSEFALDLEVRPIWTTLVVIVDVALIALFGMWLALRFWVQREEKLGAFIVSHWLDILIFGACVGIFFLAPRAAAVPVCIRLTFAGLFSIASGTVGRRFKLNRLRPSQTLALSFLGLIGAGAVLLTFPAATVDGQGATLTDAVFTMASATSVTGLIVQDTGTYWTPFGLGVLIFVMQTGAIGIMVLAASFAVLVGGRLPMDQQEGLEEAGFGNLLDLNTLEGLKRLILSITAATLAIEFLGGLLMFGGWALGLMELRPEYDTWGRALFWCMFHSISAFCHAGFSLEPDSLSSFVRNPFVGGLFALLITLGAVGFPVLADLVPRRDHSGKLHLTPRRLWRQFHIQTKVVIAATLVLNVFGMVTWLFFEYDRSLRGLSAFHKVAASLFQSISLRSAGFNTIDIGAIGAPMLVISLLLMFIGSAPASTGGGVRVTTATVVLLSVRTMLRGREDVEVFGRTLPKTLVYRSIAIVLAGGFFAGLLTIVVLATQTHLPLDKLLFETMSAYGTVGLSMGVTSELDTTGRWVMSLAMYVGRVGPLTMALAVGERLSAKTYRYPEGRMAVG